MFFIILTSVAWNYRSTFVWHLGISSFRQLDASHPVYNKTSMFTTFIRFPWRVNAVITFKKIQIQIDVLVSFISEEYFNNWRTKQIKCYSFQIWTLKDKRMSWLHNTRGQKGHVTCTWVQFCTLLTDRPRRPFLFTDRQKKPQTW